LTGHKGCQQNDQDHRNKKRQDHDGDQLAWRLDQRGVFIARHKAPGDSIALLAAFLIRVQAEKMRGATASQSGQV
jgi:hypothetical protein